MDAPFTATETELFGVAATSDMVLLCVTFGPCGAEVLTADKYSVSSASSSEKLEVKNLWLAPPVVLPGGQSSKSADDIEAR